MSSPEIRPQFTLYVGLAAGEALDAIEAHLRGGDAKVNGWVAHPYGELRMINEKGRFWAPRLSVYAEDTAGGVHLMCRLGPKPDVWTLYMALYALNIISALVFGGLVYSKWTLGEPVFWSSVGAIAPALIVAGLYVSAFIGQGLGREDMHHLHEELMRALRARPGADPVETKVAAGV